MLPAATLAALLGYLLGSIPSGYLVGRSKGIDIREHGSRNIGATNVVRVLGKGPGFFVFACDALKGWLAVWLWHARPAGAGTLDARSSPTLLMPDQQFTGHELALLAVTAAAACILGHNFPVWLRFRGGKGIATTAGILLGMMPLAVVIGAVVWAAAFFTLRYVSVASLLAAVALPLTVGALWQRGRVDGALFLFSLLAAALAWWRHRANLQRLLAGTEPRFEKKPRPTVPS